MDAETIIQLVKRKPTEEVLTENRLREMLEQGVKLIHYQGYEISGFLHLGTASGAFKFADFQKAGIETTLFLADWHSYLNNKLGGDIDLIRKIAKGYFAKTFLRCVEASGGDPDKVKVVLASELYDEEYWELVMKCSKEITLNRVKRALTIAGRLSADSQPFSMFMYVPMQVADIFKLRVNIAHAGMDQRKAHVIAIEIGEKVAGYTPVAVHHHIFSSLKVTKESLQILEKLKRKEIPKEEIDTAILAIKMSKSKPETCIFVHDSPEVIREKVRKGYCPAKEVEGNPVWEIVEWLIFREEPTEFTIVNEKTGEERTYNTLEELKRDWIEGKIHPLDLKNAVAEWIIKWFEPVRKWLEGPGRKYFEEMKEATITR